MEKRYDHLTSEKAIQALWEQEKIYHYTPKAGQETFSIDTPPPTVSGALHIGHIFSYTHADIIARYKRMRGLAVFYPMGFDDNGLATERFVEKTHKTRAHHMTRSAFIDLCLRETTQVEAQFESLWRSMGLSIDWAHIYSTISPKARKTAQYSFIDLYNKDLILRKEEPSLFCTTCRTAVAQAELDSLEVASTFNDIVFTTESGEELIIATTRPELLAGCVAIFYHPEDPKYKHLAGQNARSPIYNKLVPILADDTVDPLKGTGLVMCCTFGDQHDILWFKKHNLPLIQVVGFDGTWTALTGELMGMTVHHARKKILELLAQAGALRAQKAITHHVQVHERCKQEIEYLVLKQWFINLLDHKDTFLRRADEIRWFPAFMKSRYVDWVSNLSWDWCISRQRFFGIPFPVWHCKDCAHVLLAKLEDLPIDPQETPYPYGNCTQCGSSNITPDTDVMDTWNTSSLTPQINNNWPGQPIIPAPMSMRPQAHDIIRTWAFYTIVKAQYHQDMIPWRDIVISGHVLAGKEKISKSKDNNKLAPEALLAQYSADTIRYWAASGALGTDTAFSENQLKIGSKLITKLWNAFLFMQPHITNYQKTDAIPQDALNQWLLHEFSSVVKRYITHFEAYDYHHALATIETFFYQTFCDNYLELVKDRFFNPEKYSEADRVATQYTLYEVGLGILQLLAPFMPYVTETIYQEIARGHEGVSSLHTLVINLARYDYHFTESVQTLTTVLSIVAHVRKLKSEHALSLKTPLGRLTIAAADQAQVDALSSQITVLSGITHAQEIVFSTSGVTPGMNSIDDVWYAQIDLK